MQMDRLASVPRTERGPDGLDYQVRRLPSAAKEYTCPACLRPIPQGSAHIVAWPEEAPFDCPRGWTVAVTGTRSVGVVACDRCDVRM